MYGVVGQLMPLSWQLFMNGNIGFVELIVLF